MSNQEYFREGGGARMGAALWDYTPPPLQEHVIVIEAVKICRFAKRQIILPLFMVY